MDGTRGVHKRAEFAGKGGGGVSGLPVVSFRIPLKSGGSGGYTGVDYYDDLPVLKIWNQVYLKSGLFSSGNAGGETAIGPQTELVIEVKMNAVRREVVGRFTNEEVPIIIFPSRSD
jgi:hypothetical protein